MEMGGNRSTRRKPTQTRGERANSTHRHPRMLEVDFNFLLFTNSGDSPSIFWHLGIREATKSRTENKYNHGSYSHGANIVYYLPSVDRVA